MIGDNYILVIRTDKSEALFATAQAEVERIIKEGVYLPLGAPIILDRPSQLVFIQAMLSREASK